MDFILLIIFFVISYTINVFYLFNAFVPLLWLPYVFYKVFKKEYRPSAILMCIVAPIAWNLGFILLGFLIAKIGLYKYMEYFFNSAGATFGSLVALISVILNMFSKQSRQEFKSGLESFRL